MPAIESTGWSRFVDLFRGDMEAVRDVASVFLEESETQATTMQQALEEGDSATVRRIAHSMQSTARQIGALELADSASRIEAAGREGDMNTARQAAPDFYKLLGEVRDELRARLA